MGAGEPAAGVPAGIRAPPCSSLPAPVGSGRTASPACRQCHLSAAPPPSPQSHSTRSGSFVVGVLINFILINSVTQAVCKICAEHGSVMDLQKGLQTNTRFISPLALYISYGWERVGWGREQECCLPAGSQCRFLNALSCWGWAHRLWPHFCLFFFVGP